MPRWYAGARTRGPGVAIDAQVPYRPPCEFLVQGRHRRSRQTGEGRNLRGPSPLSAPLPSAELGWRGRYETASSQARIIRDGTFWIFLTGRDFVKHSPSGLSHPPLRLVSEGGWGRNPGRKRGTTEAALRGGPRPVRRPFQRHHGRAGGAGTAPTPARENFFPSFSAYTAKHEANP